MNQSLGELIPRMIISMVIVIGVMWLAARFLQKRGIAKGPSNNNSRQAPLLQVLARQGVGRRANIAVVRAGNKTLVVGITEHNVSVLGEVTSETTIGSNDESHGESHTLDMNELESQWTGISVDEDVNPASSQAWTGLLSQIRERTVRRS